MGAQAVLGGSTAWVSEIDPGRHPWLWHAVKVRRGFATEILWESGK